MYNLVTNLVDEIYHGKTGEFLGYATFELPQAEEDKVLNLVNYGETLKFLILLNLDVVKTAKDYVPPELIQKYPRTGIIRALFRDADSGALTPIEIRLTYDARGRGQETGDVYHFDSVEYSNIKVDEIRYNTSSN